MDAEDQLLADFIHHGYEQGSIGPEDLRGFLLQFDENGGADHFFANKLVPAIKKTLATRGINAVVEVNLAAKSIKFKGGRHGR